MDNSGVALTLNAGSSSVKTALFRTVPSVRLLYRGTVDQQDGEARFTAHDPSGGVLADEIVTGDAVPHLLSVAERHLAGQRLVAIGHRVVHGGDRPKRTVFSSIASAWAWSEGGRCSQA